MLSVQTVAQRVEKAPVSGRRDVQGFSGRQIDPRREDVHVAAAVRPAVQNRAPAVAAGIQPGPRRLLEPVEDRADLRVRRAVLRRPRDHARGVSVLEAERVGRRRHQLRIAAQNLDAGADASGGIHFPQQVPGRPPSAPGSPPDEFNQHRRGFRSGCRGVSPASSLRSAISAAVTRTASAADLCVFAQRASWLRLQPILAI